MTYNEKFYELIGLKDFSPIEDVKKKYREFAWKLHPDLGGNLEKMQILNNVYDVLTKKKDHYDGWLRARLESKKQEVTILFRQSHWGNYSSSSVTDGFYGGFTS